MKLSILPLLILCSCADSTNEVELVDPDGVGVEITGTAMIGLKAYFRGITDNASPASVLDIHLRDVDGLPTTLRIDFADDPHTLFDNSDPELADQLLFFYTVTIDVDGDGQICPGDWIRDGVTELFTDTDGTIYTGFVTPPSSFQIALTPAPNDYRCHPQ